ncbi:hypothetical protein GTI95_27450, partial [Citrobacter werkmanii]|nr:hypothetical protein [Citrobacter werkmanii]
TITEITECFEYFFSSLYRREFVKTLRLNECSERELLPLVRCYLLCCTLHITYARTIPR